MSVHTLAIFNLLRKMKLFSENLLSFATQFPITSHFLAPRSNDKSSSALASIWKSISTPPMATAFISLAIGQIPTLKVSHNSQVTIHLWHQSDLGPRESHTLLSRVHSYATVSPSSLFPLIQRRRSSAPRGLCVSSARWPVRWAT